MSLQTNEINCSITTYFDIDTAIQLNKIAENKQCSNSEIIQEVVCGYINAISLLKREVQKGLDDIQAGRVISHEEVKTKFRNLGVDVD